MTFSRLTFRTLVAAFTTTFALTASIKLHAAIELLDRVVAIVDQSTISQSQLDDRIAEITARSRAANVNLPPMNVLREQILDQLITETLQLNVAQMYGVKTSDEDVLNGIRSIMENNNLSEEQLMRSIAQDGLTFNEFRENIRRQLTLKTISEGVVSSRITISDKDIDSFLNSADAKFWISPDYHLQHILIPILASGTSAAEEAQNKAESIYQRLLNGANFSEIAIAESKGPAALEGGDLGFRKTSALPSLFADIVPSLEVNGISKPARSPAGFHILKLLEIRGESKQVVKQSKVRHILIKPTEILDSEQAKAKLADIRKDILDGKNFSTMAKQYSDDIGSKMNGGEMGWTNPGTFVPEFEQAMVKTPEDTISEPFLTQFGWHILEVMETRDEDLSENVKRDRARNLLIGRRFEDEVQVWLQEIRDDAFIEIKI